MKGRGKAYIVNKDGTPALKEFFEKVNSIEEKVGGLPYPEYREDFNRLARMVQDTYETLDSRMSELNKKLDAFASVTVFAEEERKTIWQKIRSLF